MGLAPDSTVIPSAEYQAHAGGLALRPIHLPHLRERSSCSPSVPGDVRSKRQVAGGEVQLGTFATAEPARDACPKDSRGYSEGGRRIEQGACRRRDLGPQVQVYILGYQTGWPEEAWDVA